MLPEDFITQLQEAYPKRAGGQGWGHLRKRIPELIKEGFAWEEMLEGAKNYALFCRVSGQERTAYVMQARTFYGPGEWWMEPYDLPDSGETQLSLDDEAKVIGIERQEGESNDSLRRRIGIAQTQKQYGIK